MPLHLSLCMHKDARALLDHVISLIALAPDRQCALLSRDDIVKLVMAVKCNFPEMPKPSTRAIGDAIKRRFGVEAGKQGGVEEGGVEGCGVEGCGGDNHVIIISKYQA